MKIKIIIFILILSSFSACNLLDTEPYRSIQAEDAFKTKKGLDAALHGTYNVLQSGSIAQDVIIFPDLAADNLIASGSKNEYKQVSNNYIFADNSYIYALWSNLYDGINRANTILANIDNVSNITNEEKEIYLGQVKYLRAYFYFTLVNFYGGVPIRDLPVTDAKPETLNIGRSSVDQVYNFILQDLTEAENHFNGYGEDIPSYANEGAVKAFLSRVYLYRGQWINAAAKAQEVIDMNYSLELVDYSSIFDETSVNDEIIFQIDFINDQESINAIADWAMIDGRFEVAAWEDPDNTSSIADYYETGDLRKDATVLYNIPQAEYYCTKYTDTGTDKDNIIIFRLAEMYLIIAEALNEIGYVADGDAFTALNIIRSRAGLVDLSSTELTNQDDFRLAVEQERRMEFAFEGHRLFDLKRTGRADIVLPDLGNLKDAQWLFPIPQDELDTNEHPNMIQNSPY